MAQRPYIPPSSRLPFVSDFSRPYPTYGLREVLSPTQIRTLTSHPEPLPNAKKPSSSSSLPENAVWRKHENAQLKQFVLQNESLREAKKTKVQVMKSAFKGSQQSNQSLVLAPLISDTQDKNKKTGLSTAGRNQSESLKPGYSEIRDIHQARGILLESLLHTRVSHPTPPLTVQPLPQVPEPARRPSKAETAASLRNQLLQRFRQQDPEEPPSDPLDMSVLQRSNYFLSKKQAKLKTEVEQKLAKEVEECTFHPILYTQIRHKNMNKSTQELLKLSFENAASRPLSRSRSLSRPRTLSYSQLYLRTHDGSAGDTPTEYASRQVRRRSEDAYGRLRGQNNYES